MIEKVTILWSRQKTDWFTFFNGFSPSSHILILYVIVYVCVCVSPNNLLVYLWNAILSGIVHVAYKMSSSSGCNKTVNPTYKNALTAKKSRVLIRGLKERDESILKYFLLLY